MIKERDELTRKELMAVEEIESRWNTRFLRKIEEYYDVHDDCFVFREPKNLNEHHDFYFDIISTVRHYCGEYYDGSKKSVLADSE